MTAEVLHNDDETMTIKVTVKKSAAFLECKENIQDALNKAGSLATEQCLEDFDSDGSPITVAGRKLTAKKPGFKLLAHRVVGRDAVMW